MKAMKKSITLALALVMLLSCMVFPAAAARYPFKDVPAGAWYAEYVQYVYENGLMNGTSTTAFSPETKMDRAMLVTVLYRMDGSKSVSGSTPFKDIKTDGYYYNALLWAYQNGIINGTSATQFSPSVSITREMMVTIFYRYAQHIGRDVSKLDGLSGYTDSGRISDYAKMAFQWAVANGIIQGTSSTALSPKGTATRAQCATILKRFCEWSEANAGEETKPTEPSEPVNPSEPTEPEPTEHEHSYSSKVTKAATCGATGTKTFTCSRCNGSYTESIPKTSSHSYGAWVTTKEPTTTATGTAERKCGVCGTKETKTLDKLPAAHTCGYTSEVTKAATCTAEGVMTYSCSCGKSYTETIPTVAHNWVTHTTEEVGHEEGYYVCHCGGFSYSVELANANPNAFGASFVAHKNKAKEETGTIAGHSYYCIGKWVVDVPATSYTECSVCGARK